MDAFEDGVPFSKVAMAQSRAHAEMVLNDMCKEEVDQDSLDSSFVQVLTPLDAFHTQLIKPRLAWFNADKERAQILADSLVPVRGKAPSLRLVDHLVVQYAREHSIMILTGDGGVPSDLWSDYRRMLSSIGKKYFDVFKRKHPVRLLILGQRIEATLGQIVFMVWYQKCKLPEYMNLHIEEVRQHMRVMEANFKKKKESKQVLIENGRKVRAPSKPDVVKPVPVAFQGSFDMSFD